MTIAHTPRTLSEALQIMSDASSGVVPVAGCTDLMVEDLVTRRSHAAVLDLLRLDELRGIREEDGRLDIGAACTFREIRDSALVERNAPILCEAAATVGGWQIQNRATIGGNVANASPAGDSLPVLLALDAQLVLAGASGTRTIAASDMHVGYRKTALEPGELIVRIRLPLATRNAVQLFRKVGTRSALAISKVVLAFAAHRTDEGLENVRIAAGSVAAIPMRLAAAEAACTGVALTRSVARSAATVAAREAAPIDDVRSTARYRSHVLERLVYRMAVKAGDLP